MALTLPPLGRPPESLPKPREVAWTNRTTYEANLNSRTAYAAYPGADRGSVPSSNAGGITRMHWTIESKCAPSQNGYRFDRFDVQFEAKVHVRPDLAASKLVKDAEDQHVADFQQWANTSGKQIAAEREERYRRVPFASEAACVTATKESLSGALAQSARGAVIETINRYDYEGGPHNHGPLKR